MSKQAGKSSSRSNGSSNNSNGSSNVVTAPGNNNKVAINSVVGAIRAAPILNLDGADDGPGNGGATASQRGQGRSASTTTRNKVVVSKRRSLNNACARCVRRVGNFVKDYADGDKNSGGDCHY